LYWNDSKEVGKGCRECEEGKSTSCGGGHINSAGIESNLLVKVDGV
jgi:hypothetical protein